MIAIDLKVQLHDVGRAEICQAILAELPEWFGIREARDAYARYAATAPMVTAEVNKEVVGYVSLACHFDRNCEIHSMGVRPQWHRQGVGAALVEAAVDFANSKGFKFLSVKTLSDSHPDPNYAATRAFYHSVGFVPFEVLPELWGAQLPCLMMVRQLK